MSNFGKTITSKTTRKHYLLPIGGVPKSRVLLKRLTVERLEERALLSLTPLASTIIGPTAPTSGSLPPVALTFADGGVVQAAGQALKVNAYSVPSLADWNADGLEDLIVGEKTAVGEGKIRVYLNSGTASAPEFQSYSYVQANGSDLTVSAAGCLGIFPRLYDLDGDGKNDLVAGLADGRVEFWVNVGTNAAPQFGSSIFLQVGPSGGKQDINVGARATLDIGDWDNDGRIDLVVGGLDGRIHVFLNQAVSGMPDYQAGTVLQSNGSDLIVPSGRASVAVIYSDTCKDIVAGNTEGQLVFYRNVGTEEAPAFADYELLGASGKTVDLDGTPRSRPSVCDWNQDGISDLLVGAADGQVRLYLGTAPTSTADPRSPLALQDAAGQAVDIPLESNTLIVGTATWCPHCREFKQWLSTPAVQERIAGLRVVLVFGDESSRGNGPTFDPAFLQDSPGDVVFLAAASRVRPNAYPTIYDPNQGTFVLTSPQQAIDTWLAAHGREPLSTSQTTPATTTTVCTGDSTTTAQCSIDSTTTTENPSSTASNAAGSTNYAGEVHFNWQSASSISNVAQASINNVATTAAPAPHASSAVSAESVQRYSVEMRGGQSEEVLAETLPVEKLNVVGSLVDSFLATQLAAAGLSDPLSQLIPHRAYNDYLGMTHVRLHQTYQGVTVFGQQVLVHLNANGEISSANGSFVPNISVDVTPNLTADDAMSVAQLYFQRQYNSANAEFTEPQLFVFNPAQLDASFTSPYYLVWRIEATGSVPPTSRSFYIDAHTGQMRFDLNELRTLTCNEATALYPNPKSYLSVYRHIGDCSTSPYVTWCGIGHYLDDYGIPQFGHYRFGRREGQPKITDPHPIKSIYPGRTDYDHDLAYDMLPAAHAALWNYPVCRRGGNDYGGIGDGGSSWRNPDKTLAWVYQEDANFNCSVSEAYFQNGTIGFCSGAVSPDLVGHEYAHSVMWFLDWTGSLEPANITHMNYVGESGSLQEAYSDIFGEYFEYLYTGSNDWLIGTTSPLGPCRNMMNPRAIPHMPSYPIRYNDPNLSCCSGTSCDMHINANIIDKAAYLISSGGSFNGLLVHGIGIEKMHAIFFRAADVYFTSNTNFSDAYPILIQSARDLYGDYEATQVRTALWAVELDQAGYCSGIPGRPASGPHVNVSNVRVFYNNSAFDNTATGGSDNAAIATDKISLLSGQTPTFANYTTYSRGINGVMIDFSGGFGPLLASDFQFRVSKDRVTWSTAPTPQSINLDTALNRITTTWSDNAIKNCWLEVRIGGGLTGTADYTAYYGNFVGETGNDSFPSVVDALDEQAVIDHYTTGTPAGIDSVYDMNRDGVVDSTDLAIVYRANHTGSHIMVLGQTRTWDGGGPDDKWTTAANWVGEVAPQSFDDLVFPHGAARQTNTNDYSTDSLFSSILITGGNYDIQNGSSESIAIEVRTGAVFSVGSVVCDSLIIGSTAGSARSTTPSQDVPTAVAEASPPAGCTVLHSTQAETASTVATVSGTTVGTEQTPTERTDSATAPLAVETPLFAVAATKQGNHSLLTPRMVTTAPLREQGDGQNDEPRFEQPLPKESLLHALYFDYAGKMGIAGAFEGPTLLTDRRKESLYQPWSDALARPADQPANVYRARDYAHRAVLNSLLREYQQNPAIDALDCDLLAGTRIRKQHEFVKKSVDLFHSDWVNSMGERE